MMSLIVGVAWLLAGIVVGVLLGVAFGPAQARAKAYRAKQALADSQQRRALERLTGVNRDLMAQLEAATQRQARAVEAVKQAHAVEMRALEAELGQMREQLLNLMDENSDGHLISGTSFASTQLSGPSTR